METENIKAEGLGTGMALCLPGCDEPLRVKDVHVMGTGRVHVTTLYGSTLDLAAGEQLAVLSSTVKMGRDVAVTLPGSQGDTVWNLIPYLTGRYGDLNPFFEESRGAYALCADPQRLERLRMKLFQETTFVACKDGEFGLLMEFEYCTVEGDPGADPLGTGVELLPTAQLKQVLANHLAPFATQYPKLSFAVHAGEFSYGRANVWIFIPESEIDDALMHRFCKELWNLPDTAKAVTVQPQGN